VCVCVCVHVCIRLFLVRLCKGASNTTELQQVCVRGWGRRERVCERVCAHANEVCVCVCVYVCMCVHVCIRLFLVRVCKGASHATELQQVCVRGWGRRERACERVCAHANEVFVCVCVYVCMCVHVCERLFLVRVCKGASHATELQQVCVWMGEERECV